MNEPVYPLVDIGLARRLERVEGHANARFVEARARVSPELGAAWIEVEGAYAMFDGVGSPLTQTFGLGAFELPTAEGLASIEAFFVSRGAGVFHEVSPLADAATLALLNDRGYRPCEFTSVMFRPIASESIPVAKSQVVARPCLPDEHASWLAAAQQGWSEFPEAVDFMTGFGKVAQAAVDSTPFVGTIDGAIVATGSLVMHGGVALLAGASTVPHARGRGAQRALLEARLQHAIDHGCTLAMMCAAPGGGSQRNAERQGFRIAYTRVKWQRQAG